MAQRQLFSRSVRQALVFLKPSGWKPTAMLDSSGKSFDASLKAKMSPISSPILNHTEQLAISTHNDRNKAFIDLFTNNPHKKLYMPTISINQIKVYEDTALKQSIIDPLVNDTKVIDAPVPGRPEKKEAVRMILIRRRKMRKHKLRKLRKRMKFVFAKIKMRKELRKEQAFRAELLGQIEIADKFDAKAYVENILSTIRNQPKLETDAEIKERFRQIKKINKYKTHFIPPRFDD